MVRPEHFRVEYVINPYMSVTDQPDPDRTMRQWEALRDAIIAAGGAVEVVDQRPDSPDMVYAMNLRLEGRRGRVMLSHAVRAAPSEALSSAPWFSGHGFEIARTGSDGIGPHFESERLCW